MSLWDYLADQLGMTDLHRHAHRQEKHMGKLTEELADVSRRQDAIKDAVAGLTDSINTEVANLNDQIAALRDGELTDDQQSAVDAIKASADNILASVQAADDGYNPPVVEPSPFPAPGDDEPAPGSAEAVNTGAI